MFLGSMAAVTGAGFIPEVGFGAAAQRPDVRAAAGDRVLLEVQRQFAAALQGVKQGHVESARRCASLGRVWAAHLRGKTPDGRVRALARSASERLGRHAIVYGQVDQEEMYRQCRDLGLTREEIDRLDVHAPSSAQAREEALARIEKEGIAPAVERAVALIEQGALKLDEMANRMQPVAMRASLCDDLCIGVDMFKAEAEIVCALAALAPILPPMAEFGPLCALLTGLWLSVVTRCTMCKWVFG
jgi:hypothetical protein